MSDDLMERLRLVKLKLLHASLLASEGDQEEINDLIVEAREELEAMSFTEEIEVPASELPDDDLDAEISLTEHILDQLRAERARRASELQKRVQERGEKLRQQAEDQRQRELQARDDIWREVARRIEERREADRRVEWQPYTEPLKLLSGSGYDRQRLLDNYQTQYLPYRPFEVVKDTYQDRSYRRVWNHTTKRWEMEEVL